MNKSIADRAKDGALYLDKEVPGWPHMIDIDRLNMARIQDCIIGQVTTKAGADYTFGSYLHFTANFLSPTVMELGFDTEDDAEYAPLKVAWVVEIAKRLNTTVAQPLTQEACDRWNKLWDSQAQ